MSGPGQAPQGVGSTWAEVLAAMLGVRARLAALAGFRLAVMRGAGPAAMLEPMAWVTAVGGRAAAGKESSWPR